jgi:integrase/recombinase XerC
LKVTNYYIQKFLDTLLSLKNYSIHTVSNYELDLNYLHAFMQQQNLSLDTLTKQHCRQFIETHYEIKKSKTIARYISSYRSFWNYLIKEDVTYINPWKQIKLPKQSINLPHILSTKDVLDFLNNINTTTPIGIRDKAICESLYGMGLRVAELCTLEFNNCNFNKRECLITGKGNYQRIVYLGGITYKIIQDYINNARCLWKTKESKTLFINKYGNRLSERTIQRIIKQCALKQGFNKHITPHTLRHCYATDLYKGGADLAIIKDLLGHKNLSTTEIYTHVANEDLAQTLNESHPHAQN